MISDLQKVSATLQRCRVESAPATLRPPVIREEKPERGFSWMRLALALSGAVFAVLIIAAISIPNLLRSRIGTPPPARVPSLNMKLEPPTDASARKAVGRQLGLVGKTAPLPADRIIAHQVIMTVEVKEFDHAENRLRGMMDAEGRYTAQANFVETPNHPRRANLVLRVPAARLATILNEIRALGRVKEEHLNSEEVTEQVVDFEARLHNARATEQRLIEVLNKRTGKVRDILEVEQEIARTRESSAWKRSGRA
jgi:hypothetical protein